MERANVLQSLFGVVHAYDPDSGIFEIAPQQMGFAIVTSALNGGGNEMCEKLAMLFNLHWPTNTLIQFTRYTSPDIQPLMYQYQRARRGATSPVLKEITSQRLAFMEKGTREPVDQTSKLLLHDDQLVISVQVPRAGKDPTDTDMRQFQELRLAAKQTLKSAGLHAEDMDVRRYIRFMETLLNHGPAACWRHTPLSEYDEQRLICQQLLDPGNAVEVDKDGLWLGDTRVRILSPKQYPADVQFGTALRYLTDYRQGSRGIRETCMITLNVCIPDQNAMRLKLEKGRLVSTEQASQRISRLVPEYKETKRDYDIMRETVTSKGDAVVQCYISVALFNTAKGSDEQSLRLADEASQAAATNAASYWREFGFQMMPDRFICLQLFSQMVPFGADRSVKDMLERYRTMGGRHAMQLAPIMGPWRGTGTPLLTLISRDGQLQPVSIRDTDTGPHALVAAQTGSGKSFLCNELISNFRAVGGRCWVIDVGYSYKNLCDLLDGQYITLSKDSQVSLNPFSLIQSLEDEADVLAGIIAIMAAPSSALSDFQMAGLKRAILQVYSQTGADTDIDALAEVLVIDGDQRIRDIGKQLFPFTKDGEYGRFFTGRNSVRVDNPFVVLELEELKSRPHLQRVVLMQLLYQIQQAIYLGDRSVPSMVLIDEAWALLSGGQGGADETAKVIEGSYRRFRKYGASVICVTQSISDVWESPSGRAIAENTSTYFLLKQKPDAIDAIQRDNRLPFGDWGYDMLKTVHTVRGEYSEILCITERGVGIGRLVVSPFNQKLYSTNPEDVALIKRLRGQGVDVVDAVNAAVRGERQSFGDRDVRRAG